MLHYNSAKSGRDLMSIVESKHLGRFVSCLITIGLLLTSIGCSSAKPLLLTVLTTANGDISVSELGTSFFVPGTVGMQLRVGDTLKSGKDSSATVTFFEGSTLELKADTQIVITSLSQTKSGSTTILLKQTIGETISHVIKLADPKSRYEIETISATAAVRGSIMVVAITSSGVTSVGNEEGTVSIIAQGIEISIPQGSHSVALPGKAPSQPEPGTTTSTISTPFFADNIGDLFDGNGTSTNGENYLDIVKSQLSLTGGIYTLHLELNGPCPVKTAEPSTFIEWDLLIDVDSSITTGTRFPLIGNDIGYDYLIRMTLENTQYGQGILTVKTNKWSNLTYKVDGNIVELYFLASDIGSPNSFNWITAVREYLSGAPPNLPSVSDKSPNQGHYVFP
jgi:hypothetical protein